jgi:hypothetical protein
LAPSQHLPSSRVRKRSFAVQTTARLVTHLNLWQATWVRHTECLRDWSLVWLRSTRGLSQTPLHRETTDQRDIVHNHTNFW